jgi:hypothetical protein
VNRFKIQIAVCKLTKIQKKRKNIFHIQQSRNSKTEGNFTRNWGLNQANSLEYCNSHHIPIKRNPSFASTVEFGTRPLLDWHAIRLELVPFFIFKNARVCWNHAYDDPLPLLLALSVLPLLLLSNKKYRA